MSREDLGGSGPDPSVVYPWVFTHLLASRKAWRHHRNVRSHVHLELKGAAPDVNDDVPAFCLQQIHGTELDLAFMRQKFAKCPFLQQCFAGRPSCVALGLQMRGIATKVTWCLRLGGALERLTEVAPGHFAHWGSGHHPVSLIQNCVDVQHIWCKAHPLAPPFLIVSIFILTCLHERLVECKLLTAAELVRQMRVEQTDDESVPNKPVVDFPQGIPYTLL